MLLARQLNSTAEQIFCRTPLLGAPGCLVIFYESLAPKECNDLDSVSLRFSIVFAILM